MNRPSLILLGFFATVSIATSAPRIALVRITDIYRQLESTKTMQTNIENERKAIMEDERATTLKSMLAELKTLQEQYAQKSPTLPEEEKSKLARDYEIRAREAQNMQQELERYHTERTKEINKKLVSAMRASLNEIVHISQKTATEQGFDCVFDSSGETNSAVPFILYSKASTDLTDNVIAILKDSHPPTTSPAAAVAAPAASAPTSSSPANPPVTPPATPNP